MRIAGEILQHNQRTDKAKNAHSLPRLVLLLDKTEHLAPRVTLVGIGCVEGIEQHGGHRSTGRTVLRAVRIDAWGQGLPSRGVFSGSYEGCDLMRLVVFFTYEIFRTKCSYVVV